MSGLVFFPRRVVPYVPSFQFAVAPKNLFIDPRAHSKVVPSDSEKKSIYFENISSPDEKTKSPSEEKMYSPPQPPQASPSSLPENVYLGEFNEKGMLHGVGHFYYPGEQQDAFYFGQCKNGQISKKGQGYSVVIHKASGKVEFSFFDNGERCIDENNNYWNKALKVNYKAYANGDKYVGQWHMGFPHGIGFLLSENGDTYIGSFHRGVPHGFGRSVGNEVYLGHFKNGLRHGEGRLLSVDNKKIFGQFAKGVLVDKTPL